MVYNRLHCWLAYQGVVFMKIGFSLGRCIRDIVNGEIDIDSVAFIITSTNIRDEEGLKFVVIDYGYRRGYLEGLDQEKCQEVALALWNTNRLIQPRRQGMHRHMQPENAVWVDIFPTVPSASESVKTAWDNYRFMLHMIENVDNEALEAFK
jgi:hypothetical protein